MLLRFNKDPSQTIGQAWLSRTAFWHTQNHWTKDSDRRFRRPDRTPLILSGHGVSLRVDNGTFFIRGGRTHYPQKVEEYRFFPGARDLPSRIIILDCSGAITFDVLDWLSLQGVPLIRVNWKAEVVTVLGSMLGQSVDDKKADEQRKARRAGQTLEIATDLIRKKVENSIETLRIAVPPFEAREKALTVLTNTVTKLSAEPPQSTTELLGMEGSAAYAYFSGWQPILLKWVGTKRRPIPVEWHTVGPRNSDKNLNLGKNNRATHPLNAILNYAYAVLEAQIRIQIVAEGLDPSISYLHVSRPE
jgi:CRISP-associated protein Cas1